MVTFATDNMVMIIWLKKMIIPIVFWYIPIVFIDKIINFGINRRFESGDK